MKKTKILFATSNPAKVRAYRDKLENKGVELLTIKDIDISLNVEESGRNALENAYIKAKAYYDATGIIAVGMDNCLFIEGIPDDRQPGTFVRRVNGRELNDDEMIEHYMALAHEFGGRLTARWVYGMVVYDGSSHEYSWSFEDFYLTDSASSIREPGYPLDSITIVPKFNKYLTELNDDERECDEYIKADNAVAEFIINCLE